MVYDRKVNGKTLTLVVSGSLWNRSLLMMDTNTKSLWSHILGEAMEGKYKGARLETIPADMVSWKAWRTAYPKTTVLDLSRTAREYTKDAYRSPDRFVFGWAAGNRAYHCTFATMRAHPMRNLDLDGEPLLLTFEPDSTSCRLFSRNVGGKVLEFESREGAIRDRKTGSTWNRVTGVATAGPLKGKRLDHRVGIVSYTNRWTTFHPDSRKIEAPAK